MSKGKKKLEQPVGEETRTKENEKKEGSFSVIDRRLISLEALDGELPEPENDFLKPKFVATLEKKLAEKEETLRNYIRVHKDSEKAMDEYKERLRRDREQLIEREMAGLIRKLFEAMDDLDATAESAKKIPEAASLIAGIELVQKNFLKVLGSIGCAPIESQNKLFDPNYFEAVMMSDVDDKALDGVVVKELRRGYKLKETVIRPSRVAVGAFKPQQGKKEG